MPRNERQGVGADQARSSNFPLPALPFPTLPSENFQNDNMVIYNVLSKLYGIGTFRQISSSLLKPVITVNFGDVPEVHQEMMVGTFLDLIRTSVV